MSKYGLDFLCQGAYQGDLELIEECLKPGGMMGTVDDHLTDIAPLHFAATGGQIEAVQLLLKHKANPCIRAILPCDDPKASKCEYTTPTGESALDKAVKWGEDEIADILRKAMAEWEKEHPYKKPLPKEPGATPVPPWKNPYIKDPAPAEEKKPEEAKKEEFKRGPTIPTALMFPGQGSQYVKMMSGVKDMPSVKKMLATAKDILGYDLLELCLAGPEAKLEETRYCQPAMFVAGLAGLEKLKQENNKAVEQCQGMAGLSLGEYTALVAAEVLTFEDGLKLVKLRGEAMQEAAQKSPQAMLSCAGLERGKLDEVCKKAVQQAGAGEVAQVANVLFPKGFSVAGTKKAIDLAKTGAEAAGALQARLLKTSGAFHTPLMKPAQEKLIAALKEVGPKMKPPRTDLYLNVTGAKFAAGSDPAPIQDMLAQQLVSPVLWEPIVLQMIKDKMTDFYEVGPMKQLKAMMKRIDAKMWNTTTNIEV